MALTLQSRFDMDTESTTTKLECVSSIYRANSVLLQVRSAVVGMLDGWVAAVPMEKVLPSVADAIAAPKASSDGKLTGLKWMASILENGRASKGLSAVLRAAATGINDKAADVREAGSTLMSLMLEVRPFQQLVLASA